MFVTPITVKQLQLASLPVIVVAIRTQVPALLEAAAALFKM